jgi:hypothetical protein
MSLNFQKITIPKYRGGRIRLDPRNPSDPSGLEPDLIRFFKKIKLTRPDPTRIRTWSDPTRPIATSTEISYQYIIGKKSHNQTYKNSKLNNLKIKSWTIWIGSSGLLIGECGTDTDTKIPRTRLCGKAMSLFTNGSFGSKG